MYTLHLTDSAERHLEEIFQYVLSQSHSYQIAESFLNRIRHHMEILSSFPYIGAKHPTSPSVRSLHIQGYTMFYEIHPKKRIIILMVKHDRQDISSVS